MDQWFFTRELVGKVRGMAFGADEALSPAALRIVLGFLLACGENDNRLAQLLAALHFDVSLECVTAG